LSRTLLEHRGIVGVSFVFLSAWVVVTLLSAVYGATVRRVSRFRSKREEHERIVGEIPHLTEKEREIIGCLLAKNQRVFTNTPDGGYAITLISKGMVVSALKPGQAFPYWEHPYEVPRHIWRILVEHKAEFPYELPKDGQCHPWRIHWTAR
jgi:hypothetical protein